MRLRARTGLLAVAVALLLAVGCRTEHGVAHYVREVTLTPEKPRDARTGVRLLRVEPDGTVVLFIEVTGETLAVRPGETFVGEHGVYLHASDPATQSAVVAHWVYRSF